MKRPFWANLIVLIIGMNSIGKIIGIGEKISAEDVENSFSIMSYNVRLFNAYNWISEEGVEKKIFAFFKE